MQKSNLREMQVIQSLLEANNLPVSDLNDDITFFVEKANDSIIATGGIESAGNDAIIRSIAVDDAYKGKGFGSKITRQLLNYAKETGMKDIYLLTTTAENYFPRYGFKKIDRQEVPMDVKNSSQYKDVCPDSAVVMKLDYTHNK
jgi:amino-acid N-acetyltransferase